MPKLSEPEEQNQGRPGATRPSPLSAPDRFLLKRLSQLLRDDSPLALAFSGGLDSRFLAHMAARLAPNGVSVRLFHVRGPHVHWSETSQALAWAKARGVGITLVSLNPLTVPEIRANDKQRCYHCKRFLFTMLQEAVSAHPAFAGRTPTLCDGSNASDRESYRPGLRALEELGVRSPLAEAGLSKDDIHRLAAHTGMDRPDQQARPCLLTRFAYGLAPTAEALAALDEAEYAVAGLLAADGPGPAPEFRLRLVAGPETNSDGRPKTHGPVPLNSFRTELHFSAAPPAELSRRLIEAVVAQGLAEPHLRILEHISGHYDRGTSP